MFTAQLEPWLRVTLYLVVIGLCLHFAYRVYWPLNRRAVSMRAGTAWRSFFATATAFLPIFTACVVTCLFCVFVDRISPADIGLRTDLRPGAYVGAGIGIAFTSVTIIFIIGYLKGWFRVQNSMISNEFRKTLPSFCGGLTDFVNASIFEEIIMRGYVFTVLYKGAGPVAAVVGSSAVFSFFHLIMHMRLPLLFTFNAFLFGIIAAQSRAVTGALWMPMGLHIGWNFAAASVFGLPIAGRLYNGGLITCSVDGPECITGGYYSPDAGLLGTFALAFAASALLALRTLV